MQQNASLVSEVSLQPGILLYQAVLLFSLASALVPICTAPRVIFNLSHKLEGQQVVHRNMSPAGNSLCPLGVFQAPSKFKFKSTQNVLLLPTSIEAGTWQGSKNSVS